MFGWFKKKLPRDYTPEKIFYEAAPEFRWAAMDKDGSVYLHENKPSLRSVEWISGNNSKIRRITCYGEAAAKKVWKDSLMYRNDLLPAWYNPENVFKDAPEWAEYAALDATGFAWWYENRPVSTNIFWTSVTGRSTSAVVRGAEVDYGVTQKCWKQSLIERPKKKKGEMKMESREVIKPSAVVTIISGAPEWARWAAVDKDGSLWYYEYEPVRNGPTWDSGYRAKRGYNPGISEDDWMNSKIKITPKEARVDYKAGDVLVLASGEILQYVHSDWFYGLRLNERGYGIDFSYIFRDSDVSKGTIDAIYRPTGFQDLNRIVKGDVANLETVYKREQVKEMTIAQIEKELGYSIKVVKETKEGE